jgi:hypothetical protein
VPTSTPLSFQMPFESDRSWADPLLLKVAQPPPE